MQHTDQPLITEQGVSIFRRPDVDVTHMADEGAQITLGDLHGNAIRLLYPLCRHNVANISDDDYNTIVSIYKTKIPMLDDSDIQKFNAALDRLQFNPAAMLAMIRLIGDETGDRGSNDYFTLKILQKMRRANIPCEILLSNHGLEFITACEKYHQLKRFQCTTLTERNHADSLTNLQLLIDKGLIKAEEILEMYDEIYISYLKAISYTLNDDETKITFYHHAINNLSAVHGLALKHKVPFDNSSPVAIAKTIDAINAKFKEHVINKTVHTLCDERELRKAYSEGKNWEINFLTHPYEALIWNRDPAKTPRPASYRDYRIDYVHGHDPNSFCDEHIFNLDLDNNIGKHSHKKTRDATVVVFNPIGSYHAHYSHEHQLGQAIRHRPPVHQASPKEIIDEEAPPENLTVINETQFYELLSEVEDKSNKFFTRLRYEDEHNGSASLKQKLRTAGNTASALHDKLKLYANQHFVFHEDDYNTFKNNCNAAIDEARPVLEEHRGWKQLLGNLGLCLLGAGILYLGACTFHKVFTGRFLFFQTDSANILNNLDKAINVVARKH